MSTAHQPRPDLVTTIIAVCCVVVTVVVVRREFFPSPPSRSVSQLPVAIDNWESLIATGDRLGPDDARVTLLLFSDYQCPACGVFANSTFPALQARYPSDLRLVYRHWPLSQHPFAYSAARASDCAAIQGRFKEFHGLLYRHQDRLGVTPFVQFAEEAGVPDVDEFEVCASSESPSPRIDGDVQAVRGLAATGTPTIGINGMLVRASVSEQVLDSAIKAELDKLN